MALGEYRGPSSFTAFVRYASARLYKEVITRSYRYYVTESLRLMPQMMYMSRSWMDVISKPREEERDAEEIVDDIISRIGGD